MPTLSLETEAQQLAARHRAANLTALSRTQPQLAKTVAPASPAEWLFARDGFLTALEPNNRWHTGCSVPLLAARTMLKTLDPGDGVACFLHPQHAAQVRVALDRLQPNQALICVIDDADTLAMTLHCEDFSADISRGRLFFVCGDDWTARLAQLFTDVPGLPSPSRFVRLPSSDCDLIERLVADAQKVFNAQNARRSVAIANLRERWKRAPANMARTVCLIARSQFRLWDDAGDALQAALTTNATPGVTWTRFDPDAPAVCSPLALATAAGTADAIVAANVARADAPNLASMEMPWITWVTAPHAPAFQPGSRNDRLLLADPAWRDAALRNGWSSDQIAVAGWPARSVQRESRSPLLTIVADTHALDAPESLAEYSSHCLLWEKLRNTILRDPFNLPDDIVGWLRTQAAAEGIDVKTLDVDTFLTRLIVPAYQHALAAELLDAGLPLQVHGEGWTQLPRLSEYAIGPVTSRDELMTIARNSSALVHAWPGDAGAHPIDALGRPVVRRTGRRKETFVREARTALAVNASTCASPVAPLSPATIISLLEAMR